MGTHSTRDTSTAAEPAADLDPADPQPAPGPADPKPAREAATHPVTTHRVLTTGDTVTKYFVSWFRGEPVREWRALRLLSRHAPDLTPRPLHGDLDAEPPHITMTRIPGTSLGATPLTPPQTEALTEALTRLHTALPPEVLAHVPRRNADPLAAFHHFCEQFATARLPADPHVRRVHAAALEWLHSGWAERAFDPAPTGVDRSPQGSGPLATAATRKAAAAGRGLDGSPAGGFVAEPTAADVAATDLTAAGRVPVFGIGDGNLANCLWDGQRVRFVDFEDSERSDRAVQLADFVEHLSTWQFGRLDAEQFLSGFGLDVVELERVTTFRRLYAAFWFWMLLPDGPASRRNPADVAAAQVDRLAGLLGC